MKHEPRRAAFTLVELLVALALLGLLLSIAALAPPAVSIVDASRDSAERARSQAVELARSVRTVQRSDTATLLVHAMPDGRLLVDSSLGPTLRRESR